MYAQYQTVERQEPALNPWPLPNTRSAVSTTS
jgi:hypothetical protein